MLKTIDNLDVQVYARMAPNFLFRDKASGPKAHAFYFSRGPGGFRYVREAGRSQFHLSWYPSDAVVTSDGQKPWECFFYRVRYKGLKGTKENPRS